MNSSQKKEKRLLVAEDDAGFREALSLEFEDRGFALQKVDGLDQFLALTTWDFHFAIVDLKLGSQSGLGLLERLLEASPGCRVVVLTGYGSIATAVQAMKLGAVNYLTKPTSTERILGALLGQEDSALAFDLAAMPPSLAKQEREYIETVLAQCAGNVSRTAKQLGLHRQSLQRKLRKFAPSR